MATKAGDVQIDRRIERRRRCDLKSCRIRNRPAELNEGYIVLEIHRAAQPTRMDLRRALDIVNHARAVRPVPLAQGVDTDGDLEHVAELLAGLQVDLHAMRGGQHPIGRDERGAAAVTGKIDAGFAGQKALLRQTLLENLRLPRIGPARRFGADDAASLATGQGDQGPCR